MKSTSGVLLTYRNKAKNFLKINHPNIVNIKDCFKAHGTIYVITDPIYEDTNTTGNWTTLLNYTKNIRLPESEILSLTTQILDALDKIHSTGQILSDLTPSSILVQRETGKTVITHLADPKQLFRYYNKAIAQNISPGYSACEQYYASDKQGAWTNIYAMGSILYRLISGTTPDSAAYRLTHLTDLNKDSLTPALHIKHTHVKGKGFSNYSDKLLKAIDHAMQLQSIDRPQCVKELQENLGIETSSPATSDITNNTVNDTDNSAETSSAEITGLNIPGITNSPNNSVTATNPPEIDFIALSQLPIEKGKPNRKTNSVVGITAVLFASLFGVYYYFILSQNQSQNPSQALSQRQFDSVTPAREAPAIRTETLLEITSLAERVIEERVMEEKSFEESALIESTLLESDFDENSLQKVIALTPLTPLWILDVPLVKNDLSTQEHPHYLVNSTIRSVVAAFPSTNDKTGLKAELVSLASAIHVDDTLFTLVSTETTKPTIKKVNNREFVTTRQVLMKTRVAQANRTTNTHTFTARKTALTKNKSRKTRQQYQQEWVLKQRKKTNTKNRNKHSGKRPHRKTHKQYQNEWGAKQQQLKKRAAWKRKKQQLEIMKTRKTTSQIESQLLNENDW